LLREGARQDEVAPGEGEGDADNEDEEDEGVGVEAEVVGAAVDAAAVEALEFGVGLD
jgi:hypothetical protein